MSRFPSIDEVGEAFENAGFSIVSVEEATEPERPMSVVRSWCVEMRNADTLLTAFTDEEFTAGLAALERAGQDSVAGCLHLVVLE